ncbi:hypothetical protein [Thermoactinomyces sp. CICC 10522]|uniref:hypothetical protein n=1 Tax=Thermoactinomyces sp. CICC 10522 TaxID=2767427 RepID=UPI0018DBBE9A|nr:hypothetical protein [Thermoactinomyces sp. CICC 10522]MBH8602725.1 hypothetical protein [Thermoactinomyces sp. CICC 10522]
MSDDLRICLESLNEEEIRRIGNLHSVADPDPGALAGRMTDPAYLRRCFQQMPSEKRAVLLYFLFASQNGVIREREIPREQQKFGLKACRRKISEFFRGGWIFPVRNQFHERLYYLPAELRRAWIAALAAGSLPKPVNAASVMHCSEPSAGIWQAFFHFLFMLEQEPLLLTKTGQIPKKEAQKLDVELDLDASSLKETKWGKQDELPPWISFLLELSQLLGLTERTSQSVRVRQMNWQQWLQLSFDQMMRILYQAVFNLLTAERNGLHGYLQLLECLEAENWYALKEIICFLSEWDLPFFSPALLEHLEKQLIDPLVAMGWMEKGQSGSGETYFRWLELPPKGQVPDEVPFYIEPHMEIYLPYYFPLPQRYVLAQAADFMGGDRMLIYELNERSVQRARRYGLTGEDLLSLLAAWSGTEVPEPVKEQVIHWFRQAPSILAESAFLLHGSPERLDRCRRILEKKGINISEFTGERLIISAADFAAAQAALQESGQEVQQMHHSLHGNDERNIKHVDWGRLLSPLKEWRVETHWPSGLDMRSNADKLPKIWTSGLRAYGREMVKEMVKQSIHYGFALKMEYQGDLITVSPQKVEYCGGDWLMHAKVGKEKKFYPLGRISRVQVMVEQ